MTINNMESQLEKEVPSPMLNILFLFLASTFTYGDGCRTLDEPIDLGRHITEDTVYVTVPYTPGKLTEDLSGNSTWVNRQALMQVDELTGAHAGEHTGTHLDAPYHFNKNGWTVAEIPLSRLIANGIFLNVSKEVAGNSSFRLQPHHIDDWIETYGPFPNNALLLISYGWAQLYSNRTAYLGTTSKKHEDHIFPGMSANAAERLAQIDELVGVGVDTPSLDPPNVGNAHTILTAKNIYFLEHVDLDKPCLPVRGFKVFSMPMNLKYGTGAPTRVVALNARTLELIY